MFFKRVTGETISSQTIDDNSFCVVDKIEAIKRVFPTQSDAKMLAIRIKHIVSLSMQEQPPKAIVEACEFVFFDDYSN